MKSPEEYAEKVCVTVPKGLYKEANQYGLCFSKILQEALKKELEKSKKTYEELAAERISSFEANLRVRKLREQWDEYVKDCIALKRNLANAVSCYVQKERKNIIQGSEERKFKELIETYLVAQKSEDFCVRLLLAYEEHLKADYEFRRKKDSRATEGIKIEDDEEAK